METIKPNEKVILECTKFLSNIKTKRFLVAFSGGCDSSVLLHSMNSLRESNKIEIRSVHINHHYTDSSDLYEKHCSLIAKKYNLEHTTKDIYLDSQTNIEHELREKRYKAIIDVADIDECILTGHHLDDQIETFFIRLMRGSSSRGLTCMESIKFLYGKQIGRPLLNIEKSDIKLYQKNNSIEFIEDETNKLLKFDRNFIRSEIIPVLKSRWTSMNKVMKNNIKQQKINFSTISDFINHKLKDCFDRTKNRLIIEKVLKEKEYVQFSLIHEWVNINTSILLSFNQVYEVINNIVKSKNDSTPLFAFQNFLIRKYQGTLYLDKVLNESKNEDFKTWNLDSDLKFNELTLKISRLKELGIYKYLSTNKPVIVKKREGGEKIKLNADFHHKLKKIFQSKNIPSWERETYALIFVKEQLIAAYGPNDIIVSNSKR